MFNKVKHDLEVYRELLLILNSILKWEQSFFPGIIGGVLTFVFLVLWYLDFSTLTLFALATIFVTVLDYGYPLVSKFIFKAEHWSGSQEKLYEQVIQDIVEIRLSVCGAIGSFFSSRSERSTFVSSYFVIFPQVLDDPFKPPFSISSQWLSDPLFLHGSAQRSTICSWSTWQSSYWRCIQAWRKRESSSWCWQRLTLSSGHIWRKFGRKNQHPLRKQIEVIWSHFKLLVLRFIYVIFNWVKRAINFFIV